MMEALVTLSVLMVIVVSSSWQVIGRNLEGTIAFATVGRAHYGFDIFVTEYDANENEEDIRLTDGLSVNYNGHFVDATEQIALLQTTAINSRTDADSKMLTYISERDGSAQIHFSLFLDKKQENGTDHNNRGRAALEADMNFSIDFDVPDFQQGNAMHDRPSLARGKLFYVSTYQGRVESRQSWAAVYATDILTKKTIRLTPDKVTDFSPAVSPSGEWVMVASSGEKGWGGEIHELNTDLYVFQANDGSSRKLVVQNGGWPSWMDDSTVFFHRKAEDGWWSIFKATFSKDFILVREERITPAGLHTFTPASSRTGEWIAVATRRPETEYRHVEIFHLGSRFFRKVTEHIAPSSHHYNPFVSLDSKQVGYHRCRGESSLKKSIIPRLEHIKSPLHNLALVRVDGDFPVFSPDGQYIAFIPNLDEGGIFVTRLDGSGKMKVFNERSFGLFWDKQRKGVLYTSYGVGFQTEDRSVHIVSTLNADKLMNGEDTQVQWKVLTKSGTGNNAFPSASPDGKLLVFRSGRSGHKNLYIMDAVEGENRYLKRLTEGPWTDTMASWSHDGEWIAFSSDRHNPGSGSFELYFMHPNGTGVHRVLNSSIGGRVNHPFFSPDSKSLVFTSDYAGVSAEPISVPHQFQPYGEIFLAKTDGSCLERLTHNAYEDGTPSWGHIFSDPKLLKSDEGDELDCGFSDCAWLKPVERSINISK